MESYHSQLILYAKYWPISLTKPFLDALAEQVEAAKERTEYNQAIGTYKSAITPLLVLTLSIVCGSWGTKDIPRDKRVDGMFLMDSPNFVMAICYLYVLASMVWGPQFMKNRKPLTLKKPMLIYNAFQVALSFYMFIEVR